MLNIRLLKLINGEEILGKVVDETDTQIVVDKPVIIMLAPGQNGNISVQMGHYCPHTEEKIAFNKQHVVFNVEPKTDLLNGYNSAFGSGIVVPNKTLLG